jgi:aspartyl-tRNA(Asn)/glutamyl-tRNA(Gln) amidotransferase subunit B
MSANNEKYEAVIGLEVHSQLGTKSKIFCGCSTEFGAPPNTHVCPVCSGMPGVLPVFNPRVLELAIRMGLAAHCTIAPRSIFDRKNYFYPDLPKGYQISQYETPLCLGGYIELPGEPVDGGPTRIRLVRIHLEEDAGKNIHAPDCSLVDFNRSGVPLMEIVSEPDLRTPEQAGAYLRELRSMVRYLEVSDGNMEEGSFRCDANVSVRPRGSSTLGVKTEVKNMNSFRHVEHAIAYEIERQSGMLDAGERIAQETRLWDPDRGVTRSMRSKEHAHDYRYFPDPDLLPLVLDPKRVDELRKDLPELPDAKKARFERELGLSAYNASVLVAEKESADFYESVLAELEGAGTGLPKSRLAVDVANLVMGDYFAALHASGKSIAEFQVSAPMLVELLKLQYDKTLSGRLAKDVFAAMVETGKGPAALVEERGLKQVTDTGAIESAIDAVMKAQAEKVAEYRSGKDKLFGFFVGQVMKATQGKANPALVNELLKKKLAG